MPKQYGLILSGKSDRSAPSFKASRNVFGDDSDSDGDTAPKTIPRLGNKIKKQVILAQEKALNEDPTVYQYDEVYDNMEQKKKEEKSAAKVEKKPKYIEKLLESANKRKRENERRLERQVQKEREKEGSEFADKESFVTSAYKQKLEELRAEDEKEKREEYLESIGDVTKQQDLGGFYRHVYEQTLGKEDKKKDVKFSKKEEDDDGKNKQGSLQKQPKQSESDNKLPSSPQRKIRNYRKRKMSTDMAARDLSDGEIISEEEFEKVPTLEGIRATKIAKGNVPNIDADSDFSTESSDGENKVNRNEKSKTDKPEKNIVEINELQGKFTENTSADMKKSASNIQEIQEEIPEFKMPTSKETVENKSDKSVSLVNESDEAKSPAKPKVNIWEKRTVGVVFEEALRRYYERKAARSQ